MITNMKIKQSGVVLSGFVGLCALVSGCAEFSTERSGLPGHALIGMTEERLRTCAEAPLREVTEPDSTLLVYYHEAAVFEESFGGGKGSKPGYHHGCWATILTEKGRVIGVEFRPVPDPDADTHECQEIFATCAT